MYRDLKPENIVLDAKGNLSITDFGISKFFELSGDKILAGTIEYMSPEILTHKLYTPASDYWSLGILIYEMT